MLLAYTELTKPSLMQYIPYIPIIVLSGIISLLIAVFMWQRRSERGVRSFVVLMLTISVWIFGNAGELAVTSLQAKYLLTIMAYLGIALAPPTFLLFAIDYTNSMRWFKTSQRSWLFIIPLLTIAMIISNGLHGLYWSDVSLTTIDGYQMAMYSPNILFWVHVAYSYVMLVAATALLVYASINIKPLYRQQMRFILLGVFFPWVANIIYVFDFQVFQEM